jgi:hypothetical protein
VIGKATDSVFMRVEIKLEPYWQWKFGISDKFKMALQWMKDAALRKKVWKSAQDLGSLERAMNARQSVWHVVKSKKKTWKVVQCTNAVTFSVYLVLFRFLAWQIISHTHLLTSMATKLHLSSCNQEEWGQQIV